MAMDLSNYTGLQNAISDFLNRPDLIAGGQIAAFIQLTEATINRRLRRTTGTASLTVTAGDFGTAIPAGVGEIRDIAPSVSAGLPYGSAPLTELSYAALVEKYAIFGAPGRPLYYAVLDGEIYFAPAPSQQYLQMTISHFPALTPLSDAAPSNPLLVEAPDAYLYGACLESAPYLEHDERIVMWQARFDRSIDELNEKRTREEFGASIKAARLPVVIG